VGGGVPREPGEFERIHTPGDKIKCCGVGSSHTRWKQADKALAFQLLASRCDAPPRSHPFESGYNTHTPIAAHASAPLAVGSVR
jgi:hypothetical protein